MLENELTKNLEPIRKMFLAQVIHALLESDFYELLTGNASKNIALLAEEAEIDAYRLEGLLLYLKHEDIVEFIEEDIPFLTEKGLAFGSARPWYQLLVGGYGRTLLDLPTMLADRGVFGSRVGEFIGQGSCGISQFDALPMTKKLISAAGADPSCIVDIGCGDGSYLVDLCGSFPNANAIGIEPDESSAVIARELIARSNLIGRVEIKVGDLESIANLDALPNKTVFVVAFVLQEVLEQSGRDKIVDVLSRIKSNYPSGHIVVIEVDRADRDDTKMASELGQSYYNPYFLIHRLTQQRLESPDFWTEVFSDSGWQVAKTVHPEPSYDPLELKTGFLLC